MQIIIPAYKPDERMLDLIIELHENTNYDIIVVNDGSGSDFERIFSEVPEYVTLLKHDVNKGKGRAMKTAFEFIKTNRSSDIGAVIADADGQHLLNDIINVCNKLKEKPDSLVLGSRRFTGKVPFKSRWGNAITRGVFALASGIKVYDTQTGLRAIPMSHINEFIELKGERYEYEMNMLLRAAELGIAIEEVVIETVYICDNESSHFHPVRDSFKIYAVIFKFVFTSIVSFFIDYGLFALISFFTVSLPNADIGRLISTATARLISSLCNYFLNKKTVFKGSQDTKTAILKYYLTAAVVFAANYGLLTLMENALNWNKFIAQILAMIVTYPISYYIQRMFVFRSKIKKG